ncbi:hypothetical protein RUM44_006028 [Polyplax serrata]|uniref:Uncharacterized protein n=1 Tax=Polyplax serrata TaxID=468196 RepID=A0ABR1AYQ8_POLSC
MNPSRFPRDIKFVTELGYTRMDLIPCDTPTCHAAFTRARTHTSDFPFSNSTRCGNNESQIGAEFKELSLRQSTLEESLVTEKINAPPDPKDAKSRRQFKGYDQVPYAPKRNWSHHPGRREVTPGHISHTETLPPG